MRFRRLTLDELKELHEEFIHFLSANTITGDDWKEIKEKDYAKAEQLLEIFSDIVFEKSLSKIQYLERKEQNNALYFYCAEDEIHLIGINVNSEFGVDLTNKEHVKELSENPCEAKINTFKSSKKYLKNREDEIFELLNDGCLISDGKMFTTLSAISQ